MKYFTGFTFDGIRFVIEIKNRHVKHFKNAIKIQSLFIGYEGIKEKLPLYIKEGAELLASYLDNHKVKYKLTILQRPKKYKKTIYNSLNI